MYITRATFTVLSETIWKYQPQWVPMQRSWRQTPIEVSSIESTKPPRFCHFSTSRICMARSFPHIFIKRRSPLKDTWKLLALHFSAFCLFSTFLKLSPWQLRIHSFIHSSSRTFQCWPGQVIHRTSLEHLHLEIFDDVGDFLWHGPPNKRQHAK